jgi:hypothetical protein
MNFLSEPSLLLTLTTIAFLISWICAYQLFRANALAKQTRIELKNAEHKLTYLEKALSINNILNIALINSSQTKNNIELCNLLLDGCTHKSDILTAKAVENSLHSEINNAVTAIKALEEKRAFLETKIREAFETVQQKNQAAELEHNLPYAQVLLEESSLEFASTEQMKQDVLKVNQVLDSVLLKV